MITYVALLRGIAPMNPNMRNEKIRHVFEQLGFHNVKSVISSGNIIFSTPETDVSKLERMIEAALPKQLDFTSTTIIRSRAQLQKMLKDDPFAGAEHSNKKYLTVTFLQNPAGASLPSDVPLTGAELLGLRDGVVYSIVDLTTGKTPNLMALLERHLGRDITTRTWKTVQRILSKMD